MRILLIEDDEGLCELLRFHLEQEGYVLDACTDGDDGLRWMRERVHELVILDRMLPVMDGIQILQSARSEGIRAPVLLLTALGSVEQRVEGLDAGADDYLSKPFAIEELLARVRALCRRPREWEDSGILRVGDLAFDPSRRSLEGVNGTCVLSRRETELSEAFFSNPNRVLPRQALLSRVWGPDAGVEDGSLDSYIYFLRRHFLSVGSSLQIATVRGIGYKLEVLDV